jgi:serine/threonine-protein kinase
MLLSAGKRFGVYEISELIGAGGMGEVYRAHDTRLGRDVALKVLPGSLAEDTQYMARFHHQAHVLASLSHPNIASIHGLEESGDTSALVMELVDGPTLAHRIKEGPVRLEEALHIAKQIAEALEYAHEKGIIHRDLKPANVKFTPEGAVKVLDFGLAKAAERTAEDRQWESAPTVQVSLTHPGMIVGSAGYMAPEQARGVAADKRAECGQPGAMQSSGSRQAPLLPSPRSQVGYSTFLSRRPTAPY